MSIEPVKSLLSSPGKATVLKTESELTHDQATLFLGTKPTITRPGDLDKTIQRGLRFEFDVYCSFFESWYKELSGSADKINGKLELEDAFGARIAMVYQFNNVYTGGGVGLNAGHLFWKPEKGESIYTDTYGLPLFVRLGVAEAFSDNLCGFMEADFGLNVGLERQKTSFMTDMSLGIYYGQVKIALGLLFFQPDEKNFFVDKFEDGYNTGVSLIFGFRI